MQIALHTFLSPDRQEASQKKGKTPATIANTHGEIDDGEPKDFNYAKSKSPSFSARSCCVRDYLLCESDTHGC